VSAVLGKRVFNIDPVPSEHMSWDGTVTWCKRVAGKFKDAATTVHRKVMRVPPEPAPEVTQFVSHDAPYVTGNDTAARCPRT
jgi:hypothetical protein